MIIQSMHGLGDNIFIRPFIRAAAQRQRIFLETPWPEIFEDLNVDFLPLASRLRTQRKNIERQSKARWVRRPINVPVRRIAYGHQSILRFGSITRAIEEMLPLNGAEYLLNLPIARQKRERIAVVRPVTVRKEWTNEARNPLPEYINWVAEQLMKTHHVVLVADLQEKEEWLVGDLPPHHEAHIRGEATVKKLMGLFASADIVVGGVGWIVPMAIAARTKAFIILGGQGAHNSPKVITDPRMDLSRIGFAVPDNYCNCSNMRHTCNKTISNLSSQWTTFLQSVSSS